MTFLCEYQYMHTPVFADQQKHIYQHYKDIECRPEDLSRTVADYGQMSRERDW